MTISDDPAAFRAVRRSELESVRRGEELSLLLAQEYARADVSLRELETRANKAGGVRLARATCSDMLAGRRFPKKAVMVAFLRACRVSEDQIPEWERAWERIKISQNSAAQVSSAQLSRAEQNGPVPQCSPGEPGEVSAPADQGTQPVVRVPARRRKHARRRLGLLMGPTAAAALAAVIGLAALAGSNATPEGSGAGVSPRGIVTDDGRAFGSGGSSRFVVTVDPAHTEIRLTRRFDAIIAGQTATVAVDGALAAVWQPMHGETRGWREQSVALPAALTVGRSRLAITNTFVSSEKDFNEFTYFVDQKLNGAWSRTDTVDVGTNHPDSEAAHQYRITNEEWSGTRHLNYLE